MALADGQFTFLDLGSAGSDGDEAGDPGTPRYVSPERGVDGRVTIRGDIYGLGVLLWELAASQRWPTDTPPATVPASCPANATAFGNIIERCVSLEPGGRPANADAVLGALSNLGFGAHTGRQAWRQWVGGVAVPPEAEVSTVEGVASWAALLGALGIAVWTAAWFIAQMI
jgi:serine/threonine protein kinase